MKRACNSVDLLGSWAAGENHFKQQLEQATICSLKDLEPYYHEMPWSNKLAGRTVLVIHPFAKTISAQYAKRSLLFADPSVLPSFELKIMQSVQSIAYEPVPYKAWQDALDAMTEAALAINFDVAILGCGAYGFPLAARLKQAGKQAIHLGGATQLLFGIKGKRWDAHPVLSKLYNQHWVRPSKDETLPLAETVEGACYW